MSPKNRSHTESLDRLPGQPLFGHPPRAGGSPYVHASLTPKLVRRTQVPMLTAQNAVRFGPFEFDAKLQELRKNGFRVRISGTQLHLLSLFLERPQELITRDQIITRLSSDIAAPTGIHTAIHLLRTQLGDDPAQPIYIEILAGLGYRFIAPIAPVASGVFTPPAPPKPEDLFASDSGLFDAATLLNLQSDPFLNATHPRPSALSKRRLRGRTLSFILAVAALLCALAVGLARHLSTHP